MLFKNPRIQSRLFSQYVYSYFSENEQVQNEVNTFKITALTILTLLKSKHDMSKSKYNQKPKHLR